MSVLIKFAKAEQLIIKNSPKVLTSTLHHWHKPESYPRIEQEHHGLHPSGLKPYVYDGFSYEDYPKLPVEGVESKKPLNSYDIPENKQKVNKPIHAKDDLTRECNAEPRFKYPLWFQRLQFLTTILSFFGIKK